MKLNLNLNSPGRRRFLAVGVSACLSTLVSVAAETSESERRSVTIEPGVMIGSREAIRAIPGSATLVDVEAIRNQSYDNIDQILRQVPGTYVRTEDGYGIFPNISLRGVGSMRTSNVTVMEDGILSAPAPYANPAAYYIPATGRMSAIEIRKGSSQIEFGPHTSGGAINFLSTPLPLESTGYARFLYGENNEFRTHLYVGDRYETDFGAISVLVGNFYRETEGFKELDGGSNDSGFRRNEPMVKVGWEPLTETPQSLEFKLGYTSMIFRESYVGLELSDFRANPFRRYISTAADVIDTEQWRTYLRHRVELTPEWKVTTTGYYNQFSRTWFKVQEVSTEEATGAARPGSRLNPAEAIAARGDHLAVLRGERAGTVRYRNNNRNYASYGVEQIHRIQYETGDLDHQLVTGLRLHHDYEDRFQNETNFVQNAGGALGSAGRFEGPAGSQDNRRGSATALAFFAKNEIDFGALQVTPGVRVEHIWYENKNRRSGTIEDTTLTTVSPGVGAVFAATDEISLFGGVFRGVGLPSPGAAISGIDEETSIGIELGARYQNQRDFEAEAVFFFTHFDDLIVPDNLGAGGSTRTENIGKARVYGLELMAQLDLGRRLDLGFSNPWRLAVTLTEAELRNDVAAGGGGGAAVESLFAGGRKGAKLPYVPDFQIAAGTGIEGQRLGVFVDVAYVPATYGTASNTSAEVRTDGTPDARFGKTDSYFVTDLSAFYRVTPGAKVFLGVQNLFDEEYLASRVPQGPRPGAPRFAYVGMEVAF